MSIQPRVAIITGGASGIGLATARRLGQDGVKLCLAATNQEKLDRALPQLASEGFDVIGVNTDVREMAQVRAMTNAALDTFGRIDILVCSHGFSAFGSVVDHDDALWEQVIDVDLIGCYRCSKAVLPPMLAQRCGRIIYVSATSAFRCEPAWTAKCSAKSGLLGLTRGLALEVAEHNITVNAICPAWVNTERAEFGVREQAKREGKSYDQLWGEIRASYPMKRVTEPEEHANLIAYLVSDQAGGLTGQSIPLTAGAEW
jgi:NAD(P)-dependent dehydrogenase (short-subunit alcohol dehydrogenase family)